MDPGESAGGLRVRCLRFKGQERAGFTTNGFPLGEGRYYFGGGRPSVDFGERIPEDAEALSIELEILKEQEAREEFWQKFAQVSGEKDAQIRQLKKGDPRYGEHQGLEDVSEGKEIDETNGDNE